MLNMFGYGLATAGALRDRILDEVGAEPEWMSGGRGDETIMWISGPVTTLFTVQEGPEGAPDLGVLTVVTLVATVGNLAGALAFCNELNLYATTNRWTIADGRYGGEDTAILRVGCSFTVGPHNADPLAPFVLWCVREQVAIATAKMTNDISDLTGGKPCTFAHEGRTRLEAGDWHEVVFHYDRVVTPHADLPGEPLGYQFNSSLRTVVKGALDAGEPAWYSAGIDAPGPFTTYEIPFSWGEYPFGMITTADAITVDNPPTALVETLAGPHPHVGNGLLVSMRVPAGLDEDDALETVNKLNLLDEEHPGITHSIGAWFAKGTQPVYVIYLPAVLASEDQGVNLPVAMRELQFTLVRQALLAREALVAEGGSGDDSPNEVGLSAVTAPRGPAWGETGEGRNLGARVLSHLYRGLVADDTGWASPRPGGFTWWPYQQAQDIAATAYHGDAAYGAVIRIASEIRRAVPVTEESLLAVAEVNAGLTQSALVLHGDGRLELACRFFIHEGTEWWARNWAQLVAGDQLITARELGERLAGLGEAAVSAHPVSGQRRQPDGLFTLREDYLVEAARKVRRGLQPAVALIAAAGQYALPYKMAIVEDGTLEFTWRPSHSRMPAEADPAIRVIVRVADSDCGPGWLVRSYLPLAGKPGVKARWCNARNAELLAVQKDDDLTMTGGFGLTETGDCVLTTWMSPYFAEDTAMNAAGLVSSLLRYHQSTVATALNGGAALVEESPLTAEELARGLMSVVETCALTLDDVPEDYGWRAAAGDGFVMVTLAGTSRDEEPLCQMTEASVGGEDDEASGYAPDSGEEPGTAIRTTLRIPVGYNHPELSLLYAAILAHSAGRPAEQDGTPSGRDLGPVLRALEEEDMIRHEEETGWLFSVDGTSGDSRVAEGEGTGEDAARLEITAVRYGRGPMDSALRMEDSRALKISGVVGRDIDPPASVFGDSLIGTWYGEPGGSTSYEVIVPPTGIVWSTPGMARDALAWVIRHVIERVQTAVAENSMITGEEGNA